MWKSRVSRWLAALAFAGTLGFDTNAAAGPLTEVLERELQAVRDARDVLRGLAAIERDHESLEWAEEVLEHRGRESLRRLDAYKVSRAARRKQARSRARAMYKLARGGMLRLYFEDVSREHPLEESTASRVSRGRTVRWLVRHDLRELSVHTRAEDRARDELLAATRELAALSALRTMHDMERTALRAAAREIDPELDVARKLRFQAQRAEAPDSQDRRLLSKINAARARLDRGGGLDLLEGKVLRRPVAGRVTGTFGTYTDPILKLPMQRNGIELEAERRERVRAIADGTVALVGALPGFEDVVVIDHGNGYVSLTARLQTVVVEEGQELKRGALLGRVAPKSMDDGLGRTVYLELRHAERPIDPEPHLTRALLEKRGPAPAANRPPG